MKERENVIIQEKLKLFSSKLTIPFSPVTRSRPVPIPQSKPIRDPAPVPQRNPPVPSHPVPQKFDFRDPAGSHGMRDPVSRAGREIPCRALIQMSSPIGITNGNVILHPVSFHCKHANVLLKCPIEMLHRR